MKDDVISRQAAIDVLDAYQVMVENGEENPYAWARLRMCELPSEQQEIIRCKDCKWWDKKDDAPFGYCMAMKHGFVSSHWEIGIYRIYKGDFYCADGERREE